MLTDIFAHRYPDVILWQEFDERARRLLVQSFRIISEQLFPYYNNGKENKKSKEIWEYLNKQLSMELGLQDLSSRSFSYKSKDFKGIERWSSHFNTPVNICETFLVQEYDGTVSADVFIKQRLSFIEIAFRFRGQQVAEVNEDSADEIKLALIELKRVSGGKKQITGNRQDEIRAFNAQINDDFASSCHELNERLRQAGTRLDYHNGFIQLSSDETMVDQIDRPFWSIVSSPDWKNVDHDMKEAINLRDNSGRDPAWYAAKALESTIKIISDQRGWTHGSENGAGSYLNNLRSKKNGEFINAWEHGGLTDFFKNVRNSFGHGAGSDEMPELSPEQTDWAIGFCMIWIRNLIRRT